MTLSGVYAKIIKITEKRTNLAGMCFFGSLVSFGGKLRKLLGSKQKENPTTNTVVGNLWQGRRDSNTQPTVLETATLPLSHSPKHILLYYILLIKSNIFGKEN